MFTSNPRYTKKYHPLKEYVRQLDVELGRLQVVKTDRAKFHKLAAKLEQTIPRGDRSPEGQLTVELLLELDNEDKLEQIK